MCMHEHGQVKHARKHPHTHVCVLAGQAHECVSARQAREHKRPHFSQLTDGCVMCGVSMLLYPVVRPAQQWHSHKTKSIACFIEGLALQAPGWRD